jgi:hypothetical protein
MAKSTRVDGALPSSTLSKPELLPTNCLDPSLIQRYFAAKIKRTPEDCLELGRAMNFFRAACKHGEYLSSLRNAGISETTARRFTEVFLRLSNTTLKPIISAAGTQSKLFQLLPLNDDQLEELAVKGQVGELVLSKISSMTVMGMRAAVRKVLEERRKDMDVLLDEKNRLIDAERPTTTKALQPGDRIESHLAHRPGAVVKVYPDGSACILWDDGEPQGEGLGHERVPREYLVLVAHEQANASAAMEGSSTSSKTSNGEAAGPLPHQAAQGQPEELGNRSYRDAYLTERFRAILRYADEVELTGVEDALSALVIDITRGRYVPGLVAADYELTRKYWIEGGAR